VKELGDKLGEAGVKVLEFVGKLERGAVDTGTKGFNTLGRGEHAVIDSDVATNANKLLHGDLSNAYRTEPPAPPSLADQVTNGSRSEAVPPPVVCRGDTEPGGAR